MLSLNFVLSQFSFKRKFINLGNSFKTFSFIASLKVFSFSWVCFIFSAFFTECRKWSDPQKQFFPSEVDVLSDGKTRFAFSLESFSKLHCGWEKLSKLNLLRVILFVNISAFQWMSEKKSSASESKTNRYMIFIHLGREAPTHVITFWSSNYDESFNRIEDRKKLCKKNQVQT